LREIPCGEFCGCQIWPGGGIFKPKNPRRNLPGEPDRLEFRSKDEYFNWLFGTYADAIEMFNDFTITGCWNWLVRDRVMVERFNELVMRYEAAKELSVKPFESFDTAPVEMLEGMLILSREVKKAQEHKAAQDGKSARQRI
jgi:hypothetical protein